MPTNHTVDGDVYQTLIKCCPPVEYSVKPVKNGFPAHPGVAQLVHIIPALRGCWFDSHKYLSKKSCKYPPKCLNAY